MKMGTLFAAFTSIGESTTKTQINGAADLKLPKWARSLVSVSPAFAVDVLDADKAAIAKLILESEDCNITPYEVLCNPISGYDATSGQPHHAAVEHFPVNCPLEGGELIKVFGQNLVGFTGPNYVGATITIADRILGRQKFAKVGTLTGSGTAAAEVAGTAFNIHGSSRIVEVYGLVADIVKAAANALFGSFRIHSGDFKVSVPCSYGFQPISGCLGTVDGPYIAGIIRHVVSIPTNRTCRLQDYATFDLAPTAAGQFVSAVMFEKGGNPNA